MVCSSLSCWVWIVCFFLFLMIFFFRDDDDDDGEEDEFYCPNDFTLCFFFDCCPGVVFIAHSSSFSFFLFSKNFQPFKRERMIFIWIILRHISKKKKVEKKASGEFSHAWTHSKWNFSDIHYSSSWIVFQTLSMFSLVLLLCIKAENTKNKKLLCFDHLVISSSSWWSSTHVSPLSHTQNNTFQRMKWKQFRCLQLTSCWII